MQYTNLKKTNSILLFGFAVLAALYYGAAFLVPFTFAAFLAALVAPLCSLLEKAGLGKIPSALLSTLVVFVVISALSYLLIYQLTLFVNDLPLIKEQLKEFLHKLQQELSSATGISRQQQQQFLQERSDSMLQMVQDQLTIFLEELLIILVKFLLVLVYLFLFLLYRHKFEQVVLMFVADEKDEKAIQIMEENSKVVHHYLWGRVKVMSILAVMYLITFWIFKLEYAILLTIFGALITIIPYLGPFISGLLPILMYMIFGHSFSEVIIFASVVMVIQLIESYVLEPYIIGAEVKLSPLAVVVAVIIGGMIWGLAGMILFVPLSAMIKIFADHSPYLKPLGYLLGNETEVKD